jgi:15-cis-phytoene synthase
MSSASAAATVLRREPMEAATAVRAGLQRALGAGAVDGLPACPLEGQLIRPLVALAGAGGDSGEQPPLEFWRASLAVQLAHEASLVHDDVLDGATTRRGRPSVASGAGVAAALVLGDHFLTASYRHAAASGSLAFAAAFARAVERTVAGEIAQSRAAGRELTIEEYREQVLEKSGELLGIALSAHAWITGAPDAPRLHETGRRIGLVYQMVDDLLDYCAATDTGKPALADHRQGKWTWVLAEAGPGALALDEATVLEHLRRPSKTGSILTRCLTRLEAEVATLTEELGALRPEDRIVPGLLGAWLARARAAVAEEERLAGPTGRAGAPSHALRALVPPLAEVPTYLRRHSRSFHFAASFFPHRERRSIARVYAFCRVTDDIADGRRETTLEEREAVLDEWIALAREAYLGNATGLPMLDQVMTDMATAGVPFRYAADLADGVRMDLRGRRYETIAELREYTYRVASVVGLWITRLAGVTDSETLERAAAMGHAMQITNIARDVGEDLAEGRLYLPADLMTRHGVTPEALEAMLRGEIGITQGYRSLVEELLRLAEGDYAAAFPAIPRLPVPFRRPVAISATVYRGIHASIRAAGYDNLRRRAYTSPVRKLVLAYDAVRTLRALQPRSRRLTPEYTDYSLATDIVGPPRS